MDGFTFTMNSSSGSDFSNGNSDRFSLNSGGFDEILLRGSTPPLPLVLDRERGNLVRAQKSNLGKNMMSEGKEFTATKSHCEAERRRRERINGHLDMFRRLVPGTEKMDKATLLAEVIKGVKELKKKAAEASAGFLIPTDIDEIQVEEFNKNAETGSEFSFKVSFCCDYNPELLRDLRQTLNGLLRLKVTRSEVSSLGDRLVNVFYFSAYGNAKTYDEMGRRILANKIYTAFSSVLEKFTVSLEYSPKTILSNSNKRRRMSCFDSSSSSC